MTTQKPTIHIVGAGLAGSECALQLAAKGFQVVLIEMRGTEGEMTPAHKTHKAAELVCSNSFGSLSYTSAPGELKWEAEQLGSEILKSAIESRVPAGQALSMDRELFSELVNQKIARNENIRRETRKITSLDDVPRPCVIATGPLTGDELAESMRQHFGDEFLYFFDAIAPILDIESVNMDIAWRADRWDKGTKDYINCPMSKQEYFDFIEAMKGARKTEPKKFEMNTPYFDGCMPIEEMLARGDMTPRFGPMSPKGLKDPKTGSNAFAVVQLRQDNKEATAYNIVGFQTKMVYSEQKRVFRMIPGLENAEFLKLGGIHRNLYINTPKRLNKDLSSQKDPLLYFAGQITGVEGYFESTCMGLLVAKFIEAKLDGRLNQDGSNVLDFVPPRATAMGSLLAAITDETKIDHFQPTNINFGHMPAAEFPDAKKRVDKTIRRAKQVSNAKSAFKDWWREQGQTLQEETPLEALATALAALSESPATEL